MPIKVDDFLGERASFPRFGKMKKGGVKTANGIGPDLQWFRFDGSPEKAAIINGLYGDKPNNIRVFLPYPTWKENFEVVYEKHGATGLQWRGDGEYLSGWRNAAGQWVHATPENRKKQPDDPSAVLLGKLSFIIPELGFGYVLLETKSKHDILEIAGNLRSYEALRGTGGLTGIPFLLCRSPRKITVPNKDSRTGTSQVIKWLVHLEIENSWVQAKLSAVAQAALPRFESVSTVRQLPAPRADVYVPNNGDMAQESEDWNDPRLFDDDEDDDDYAEVIADMDDPVDVVPPVAQDKKATKPAKPVTHVTPAAQPAVAKPLAIRPSDLRTQIKKLFGDGYVEIGKYMVAMYAGEGKTLDQMTADQLERLSARLRNLAKARALAAELFDGDADDSYKQIVDAADDKSGGADWKLSDQAIDDIIEHLQFLQTGEVKE